MKLKNLLFCVIILLFSIISLGFSTSKIYSRAVLTTDLENDTPISDIDSIPINTEKILLFTYWYNVKTDKEYEYKVAIFDGKKNILSLTPVKMTPTNSSWYTLTTYKINQRIDKPGKWKFEVYLDNKLMFRKNLDVKQVK